MIVEAKSDLEMSKERSRFKENILQSFELESSISSHQFGKSRKHSNESRSSVLLKLKPGLNNDAQTNGPVGSVSNGRLVSRLSLRPHPAGQRFVGCNLPFAHRFSAVAAPHKNGHPLPGRRFCRCKQSRSGLRWRAHAHLRLKRHFGHLHHHFGARYCSERRARA